MASILIVEDGSIVPGANTYANSETVDNFHTALMSPESVWDVAMPQENKDAFILMGMIYLESRPWRGQRKTSTQPLSFPRINLVTRDGVLIPDNVVPSVVVQTTCILAGKAKQLGLGESFFPSWDDDSRLRRRKVTDIEREWFKKGTEETLTPLPDIDMMLGDLIDSPLFSSGSGFQVLGAVRGLAPYV